MMSNGEAGVPRRKVSVVVPSFNRWPFLSRALASVLAQTGVDFEVLVVDDHSSDETPERLAAIEDPRLRVVRQESNMGVARARNRGVELARGTWVAFLDDDDFWAPTRLAEHLRLIEAAGASWGYGASLAFDGAPQGIMLPAAPDALGESLLQANVAGAPSSATVKRDLLQAVGGFDENLSALADWDLWIRLDRCGPPAVCSVPLVAYCHHASNMVNLHREEIAGELEYMAGKYAPLMPDGEDFGARTVERFQADQDRLDGRTHRAAMRYLRIALRERSRTDLARGIGLLFGERVMRRLRAMGRAGVPSPPWLAASTSFDLPGARSDVTTTGHSADPDADARPVVSVVVPTRDRWSLLETTLASVLAQDGVDLEVVVVDDGSATQPPPMATLADRRVRLIRNDGPHGVARARNLGIDQARGRWIAFLDDDDVWAPGKLRLQVDAAEAGAAAFAYAAVALVTADLGRVTVADAPPADRLVRLLREYNAIPAGASNVLVRADLVRELGGFDPSFSHLADWDLWIRLADRGHGAAVPEPLVGYRLHRASMRSTAGGVLAEVAGLDRKHGRPGRPPAGRIWLYRWLADGQLLAGQRLAAATTYLRGAVRCRSGSDAYRAVRVLLRRDSESGADDGAAARLPAVAREEWIRPLMPAGFGSRAESVRRGSPRTSITKQRPRMVAAAALDRALRRTSLRAGLAVVYHELRADQDTSAPRSSEEIALTASAEAFREQLRHFRARYRLVRAGDLLEAVHSRRRGEPFPLAVTFDDDLRSHLDVALPILRETGSTATFYLTGASLEGPASFWWERIERALEAGVGGELLGTTDRRQALDAVSALLPEQRQALSTDLLERLGGESETAGLRSGHVSAIAEAGCEIGFHTRDHERLPDLSDADLARAMRDGIADLEQAVGSRPRSIAYPHGAADARVGAAAQGAGFDSGYTTDGSAVRDDTDPLLMGRLYPSQASTAHLAYQLSVAIWRTFRGA